MCELHQNLQYPTFCDYGWYCFVFFFLLLLLFIFFILNDITANNLSRESSVISVLQWHAIVPRQKDQLTRDTSSGCGQITSRHISFIPSEYLAIYPTDWHLVKYIIVKWWYPFTCRTVLLNCWDTGNIFSYTTRTCFSSFFFRVTLWRNNQQRWYWPSSPWYSGWGTIIDSTFSPNREVLADMPFANMTDCRYTLCHYGPYHERLPFGEV